MYPIEDFSKVGISFSDTIRAKPREGIVEFIAPCYFQLRDEKDKISLVILCVPVGPGKSRVFIAPRYLFLRNILCSSIIFF